MGPLVFLAIVALVGYLIYRAIQRQRPGVTNQQNVVQVTTSPNHTLRQQSVQSIPLYVNLVQSFRGEHDKVVQTLNDVADMLDKEVHSRILPNGTMIGAPAVDHEAYRKIVSDQSTNLVEMFKDAEVGFERASGPNGTPEMLRKAYAAFLDRLISSQQALCSVEAPPTYTKSESSYRKFLTDFYGQITGWPGKLREAAAQVVGDGCDVLLSANYDVGPLQHAIQTESA